VTTPYFRPLLSIIWCKPTSPWHSVPNSSTIPFYFVTRTKRSIFSFWNK